MEQDWDTLVVLDGCRFDLFEEVVDLDRYDEYRTYDSAGSATNEWVRANFAGEAATDTIYITANPVVSREVRTAFHQFIELWKTDFDSSIGTVPPDPVTEAAVELNNQYPDKRLIVHYLQPHYPFISHPELRYATFGQTDELDVGDVNTGAKDVWEAIGLGMVDCETAWEAYAENLRMVLESIEPLLEFPGRTVVTSDHGNMIGERLWPIPIRLYGHTPHIHHPALRRIPWAVINNQKEESEGEKDVEGLSVEEKLESLGYV